MDSGNGSKGEFIHTDFHISFSGNFKVFIISSSIATQTNRISYQLGNVQDFSSMHVTTRVLSDLLHQSRANLERTLKQFIVAVITTTFHGFFFALEIL